MAEIKIPNHLLKKVGSNIVWNAYVIDVQLKNKKVLKKLVAIEGVIITGFLGAPNATSALNFTSDDIEDVWEHKNWFGRLLKQFKKIIEIFF